MIKTIPMALNIIKYIPVFLVAVLTMGCEVNIVEPSPYDVREEYLGYFDMDQYSETFRERYQYEIHITRAYGNHVYIHNFYGAGLRVIAEVREGELVIPFQKIGNYEIEGDAYSRGDHINFSYSVFNHHPEYRITDFCNSVAYR